MPIPNAGAATFPAQAQPDSVDFDILSAGHGYYGTQSGCQVTASGGMGVTVADGIAHTGSTAPVQVAQQTVTLTAAHAVLHRFDLITVNSSGVVAAVAGGAATAPVFPSLPAGTVPLAAVYVPATTTTLSAANLVDKRVPVAPQPPVLMGMARPARLVICGHSYTTGTGAAAPNGNLNYAYGWHVILRDALGGPSFLHLGVNGSVGFRANGYPTVLQGITTVRTVGATNAAMPNPGIYANTIGLNDITDFGGGLQEDSAGLRTWESAILTYLLRPLQSVVIEDSDAGWSYVGPWSTVNTTGYSGTSIKAVTDHTGLTSATYTVPSWFNGTHVHLALIGANSAPNSVAIKVAGVTVQTVDLSNRGNNILDSTQTVSYPIRVPATAGQTIKAEVQAGGGNGGFLKVDYLALEATPRPLVLFANIAKLSTYSTFWATVTDARIDAFNARTAQVIDALDIPEILYVDIDTPMNKQVTMFHADGDPHPSALGHATIAAAFLDAIQSAGPNLHGVVGGGNTDMALLTGTDIGIDSILYGPYNPHLVLPGTSTTLQNVGAALGAVTGTVAHPSADTTVGYRATLQTANTANAQILVFSAGQVWCRGDIVNTAGGCFFHCVFSPMDASYAAGGAATGTRMFFGLTDQTAATMVNTDAPAGNYVGLSYVNINGGGINNTDLVFVTRDGTTQARVDSTFAPAQGHLLSFFCVIRANGGLAYFQLDDLTTDNHVQYEQASNLPTKTVFMRDTFALQTRDAVFRNIGFHRMAAACPNRQWPDTG